MCCFLFGGLKRFFLLSRVICGSINLFCFTARFVALVLIISMLYLLDRKPFAAYFVKLKLKMTEFHEVFVHRENEIKFKIGNWTENGKLRIVNR